MSKTEDYLQEWEIAGVISPGFASLIRLRSLRL
jgi:hypothetical protein